MIVEYNGRYPNLCSGQLAVVLDEKRWIFPSYSLSSGGTIWFDNEWTEHVESGPWSIREWPEGFPEERKEEVEKEINRVISHGCCGGCV